jgi:hypothetical protein
MDERRAIKTLHQPNITDSSGQHIPFCVALYVV